jgi:diadenosine tetraphosphate (Ap4A) HIT family hydrolase
MGNQHAVAFLDTYPLSEGHTLVIPRVHEPDLFALDPDVRSAVWDLVDAVHAQLDRVQSPDGFNIGVNVLAAGGQTIPHAHVHIIPRSYGDVSDPRGGVRWVIPAKAPYWDQE